MRILVLFLIGLLQQCQAANRVLYVYNWSEYISQEILDRFLQETGIKVKLSTYDSNEILYTKLKILNSGGYDLVFPSTYFVEKMVRQDMLHPLDYEKLPNARHLDERLLNFSCDPKNRYSLPYLWGNSAILARESQIKDVVSWTDLWRTDLKSSVLLLDDMRETFAIALRSLGYSANSTDAGQIGQAYNRILELLPNVRIFNSESPRQAFLTREVKVGMTFNGDAYKAELLDSDLRYIYPKEGATLWVDSMVIPKRAKSVNEAHQFMNFLMEPEIARMVADSVGYASPNREARKLQEAGLSQNQTIYPAEPDMQRMEILTDVGPAVFLYERYWEQLKAQ